MWKRLCDFANRWTTGTMRIEALQRRISQMEEDRESIEVERVDELDSAWDDVSDVTRSNLKLGTENDSLKSEIDDLKTKLDTTVVESRDLANGFRTTISDEKKAHRTEIDDLMQQLKEANGQIEVMKVEIKGMARVNSTLISRFDAMTAMNMRVKADAQSDPSFDSPIV